MFKNRQKIASRQAKILSPTGSQNRQLGDKSPFLVTLHSASSHSTERDSSLTPSKRGRSLPFLVGPVRRGLQKQKKEEATL